MSDRLATVGTAVRRAAAKMRKAATTRPDPCGCTPTSHCDRHCRIKIHPTRDPQGHRFWSAECNSRGNLDYDHDSHRVGSRDLWALHEWATAHVARHRLRAFLRTK